jgi:putative PEP-CTERM system histidine kinase
MHDLKNVIAQQSLLIENSAKHKQNPAFIDDVIETVKGSVYRMRRILEHLRQNQVQQRSERVELGKLIMQAASQCADRKPEPIVQLCDNQVWVRADHDRLLMALCHAIRNAQDASRQDAEVRVTVSCTSARCEIHVIDSGVGMTEAFIRDRLFRPFDSTKGTQGMGIGAYQIRETVRGLGGDVRVISEPERGTCLVLELPRAA